MPAPPESWKPSPPNNNYELEDIRDENYQLKREISELKMKNRSMEEEVAKAQRNADAERHDKNEVKR